MQRQNCRQSSVAVLATARWRAVSRRALPSPHRHLTAPARTQVPADASDAEKLAVAALNAYVAEKIAPENPNPEPGDAADRFMTQIEVPSFRCSHCQQPHFARPNFEEPAEHQERLEPQQGVAPCLQKAWNQSRRGKRISTVAALLRLCGRCTTSLHVSQPAGRASVS